MIDEVREAFTEEAEAIVEHDDLELIGAERSRPSRTAASQRAAGEDAPPAEVHAPADAGDAVVDGDPEAIDEKPVIECHRFDERPEAGTARRLSILRDRSGGRRSRRRGRHGSDPPE